MKIRRLYFTWLSGSANDNIIKTLKANNIKWRYNKYFELEADIYHTGEYIKLTHKHIADNTHQIITA